MRISKIKQNIVKSGVRGLSMATNTVPQAQVMSLSQLPVGTGLEDGVLGQNITIFGATGFVARYLFNDLGRKGPVLTAATRGDDMEWRHLKPLCNLGRLTPSYFELRDEDSVRQAISGSDVVVNLAGKHYETKHYFPTLINWSYEDLHAKGSETIARIAREEGVKHLVHLSSTATMYPDEDITSRWALSKKRGEEAVRKEFPGATIVRSNLIFGEEDRLLNWYARQMLAFGTVPLFNGGAAKVRPVYVNDVAKVLSIVATDWSFCDETIDLHGPHEFTYKEIVEYVAATINKKITLLDMPEFVASYFGRFHELFPDPRWTLDRIKLMEQNQLAQDSSSLSFSDFGITPNQLEIKGFNTLFKYKAGGNYTDPKTKAIEHA